MSAINSNLPLGAPASTDNAFSELSSQEFLEIMLTELTYQDPLEPNDTSALLDQVSTLRSIESDMNLADRLQSITQQNQLAAAGQLIGRYTTGISLENDRVGGVVLSVNRTDEGPILNLDSGARVMLDNIDEIIDLRLFESGDDSEQDDAEETADAGDEG